MFEKTIDLIPDNISYLRESIVLYISDLYHTPNFIGETELDKAFSLIVERLILSDSSNIKLEASQELLKLTSSRSHINISNIISALSKFNNLSIDITRRLSPDESAKFTKSVIKLFTHFASFYSQEEYLQQVNYQKGLAYECATELARKFPKLAFVLGGSLAGDRVKSLWHPYFSDIDIIPLAVEILHNTEIEVLDKSYRELSRPEWLYTNYGAKPGVYGVNRHPLQSMYVINQTSTLDWFERRTVQMLFRSGSEFLTGNFEIYSNYKNKLFELGIQI